MSLLHRASFLTSAARLDQLPAAGAPEVCFVGRSNAGKSTAINVLCNQRRLAFSSKTPGRTRLINMFGLPDPLDPEGHIGYLVDLPGYGYASVARNEKEKWADILGGYLRDRESLVASYCSSTSAAASPNWTAASPTSSPPPDARCWRC